MKRSHPRLLRQGNALRCKYCVIRVTSVMSFRIVEPQHAGFRTTSLICNPTHHDAAGCILLVFAPNPHPLTNPISTNIMESAAESWSVGSAPSVVPGEIEAVEPAIHTGAAEGTLQDAGHLPIFLSACSLRIGGCECVSTCGRRDCAVVGRPVTERAAKTRQRLRHARFVAPMRHFLGLLRTLHRLLIRECEPFSGSKQSCMCAACRLHQSSTNRCYTTACCRCVPMPTEEADTIPALACLLPCSSLPCRWRQCF